MQSVISTHTFLSFQKHSLLFYAVIYLRKPPTVTRIEPFQLINTARNAGGSYVSLVSPQRGSKSVLRSGPHVSGIPYQ